MTATEKMRAILRELGVEYRNVNSMVTDVEHDGIKTRVYDYDDGPDYQLCVEQKWLTAEEAVRVARGVKPQEVLERRIDELCAEVEAEKQSNAKLREQVDAAHMSRLLTENENESLRELCGFMLRCMKRNHDCDCCLVNGEHCEISYIESDARELGVEVDE